MVDCRIQGSDCYLTYGHPYKMANPLVIARYSYCKSKMAATTSHLSAEAARPDFVQFFHIGF